MKEFDICQTDSFNGYVNNFPFILADKLMLQKKIICKLQLRIYLLYENRTINNRLTKQCFEVLFYKIYL